MPDFINPQIYGQYSLVPEARLPETAPPHDGSWRVSFRFGALDQFGNKTYEPIWVKDDPEIAALLEHPLVKAFLKDFLKAFPLVG
jgi:hypothetical protein